MKTKEVMALADLISAKYRKAIFNLGKRIGKDIVCKEQSDWECLKALVRHRANFDLDFNIICEATKKRIEYERATNK